MAFGPPPYSNEITCAECGKNLPDATKRCGLCDLPVCNDTCQLGHNHYIECQILQPVRNSVHDLTLKLKSVLPIRILATKSSSETAYNRSKLFNLGILMVKILKVIYSEFFFLEYLLPTCLDLDSTKLEPGLIEFVSSLTSVSPEEAKRAVILARKRTVDSPNNTSVFFPIFSTTKHNCSPNAKFIVYPNHCIAMQAQKLIPCGQEIKVR